MHKLVLVLLVSLLHACSCDGERRGQPNGSGAGGSGGVGGSGAAGASGTAAGGTSGAAGLPDAEPPIEDAGPDAEPDAAPAVPTSEQGACVAYMLAMQNRIFRTCEGLAPASNIVQLDCPERLLAPGSPFDFDSLVACAKAWATFDCERARNYEAPDGCAIAGERAEGQTCFYDVQCASGRCTNGPAGCTVCARIVDPDESCDTFGVACPPGEYCDMTGTCVAEGPYELFDVLPIGEPCFTDADCGSQFDFEDSDPRCLYPEGDTSQRRCLPVPTVGEKCAYKFPPNEYTCYGGYCDAEHQCRPLPVEGEPCHYWEGITSGSCADGFYCDPPPVDRCAPYKAVGDLCSPGGDTYQCGTTPRDTGNEANACLCEGQASCDAARCAQGRVIGERCDEPNTFCQYPGVCDGSTCVRGPDFDFACAPN